MPNLDARFVSIRIGCRIVFSFSLTNICFSAAHITNFFGCCAQMARNGARGLVLFLVHATVSYLHHISNANSVLVVHICSVLLYRVNYIRRENSRKISKHFRYLP